MSLRKPIFVHLDSYKELMNEITLVKNTLKESTDSLTRVAEFKEDEDKEFNKWGNQIKDIQRNWLGKRYIDTDIPEFDYGKCAEGFGCYGESVSDPNELRSALERAKNSNKPAVIDVKIKY